jgi:uncharacterized protein (TIGR02996 family)
MSRPELLALLQAAKETPEDDAPRLVLADWLEEHGDEQDAAHAELIRLQCRLARLGAADPQRGPLDRRVTALQGRLVAVSRQHIPVAVCSELKFRRGLLHMDWTDAAEYVRITVKLARTETWAWVESLHLCDIAGIRPGRGAVKRLAAVELLAGLTQLDVPGCRLGDRGLQVLAGSRHFPRLLALNLSLNGIGPTGVAALDAPLFSRLRQLDLSNNRLGLQGVRLLAGSVHLQHLTTLRLGGWHSSVGSEEVAALTSSPHLTGLTHLQLGGNGVVYPDTGIGPTGAAALASASSLANLTTLELPANSVGDEGSAALAASPHLLRLAHLDLSSNGIGSAGATALASSPSLASLATLYLFENPIGVDGALALAESPSLGRLTRLVVDDSLGPAAQDALLQRFGDAVVFETQIPF